MSKPSIPNKVLRITHMGRIFNAQLWADTNRATLVDAATNTIVCELEGINDKDVVKINDAMRKAARYIMGIERDYHKLRTQGFTFPEKPKPAPLPPNEPKKDDKKGPKQPAWLR